MKIWRLPLVPQILRVQALEKYGCIPTVSSVLLLLTKGCLATHAALLETIGSKAYPDVCMHNTTAGALWGHWGCYGQAGIFRTHPEEKVATGQHSGSGTGPDQITGTGNTLQPYQHLFYPAEGPHGCNPLYFRPTFTGAALWAMLLGTGTVESHRLHGKTFLGCHRGEQLSLISHSREQKRPHRRLTAPRICAIALLPAVSLASSTCPPSRRPNTSYFAPPAICSHPR